MTTQIDGAGRRGRRRLAGRPVGCGGGCGSRRLDTFAKPVPGKSGVDNGASTSTMAVTRQDLSSQTQVSATLGYAGSYSVVNQAQGTVTSLPAVGQVVSQGQVLYQVNGAPVVLLYGATPAYRSLSEDMTGADVEELNADLVALGYVTSAELSPSSDEFTYWTKVGVEKLQAALGVTQNGTLTLGQAVFEPTAVRVTSFGHPGRPGPGGPAGALRHLDHPPGQHRPRRRPSSPRWRVGDKVTITLPNNQTTPGVISSVGTVATAPAAGSAGYVADHHRAGEPDRPGRHRDLGPGPGERDDHHRHRHERPGGARRRPAGPGGRRLRGRGGGCRRHPPLVPVSLGLFDDADGLVQVTGPGLAAGQQVVVPSL